MDNLRIPGKLFLIGEYGVIEGGEALLAAIRPGFSYFRGSSNIHSDSPLGVHSRNFGTSPDVVLDQGTSLNPGFGTSTAELVSALWFQQGSPPSIETLWPWYKKTFPKTSGADLLVQLEALKTSKSLFQVSNQGKIQALPSSELFEQILIFQTDGGEKLATHEALSGYLAKIPLEESNVLSRKLQAGLLLNDETSFKALGEFAEILSRFGLETSHGRQVRLAFQKNASVISAKGCGAGLHDVFIVGVRKNFFLKPLLEIAHEHRLHYLGTLKERAW